MTSFYQSLTVNTEVSHVVYVRASCLQGVLLARNLQELLFMGTQGYDAGCSQLAGFAADGTALLGLLLMGLQTKWMAHCVIC